MWGLSLLAVRGGYSPVVHRLSCSTTCGILVPWPETESVFLHWQENSQPLAHQGRFPAFLRMDERHGLILLTGQGSLLQTSTTVMDGNVIGSPGGLPLHKVSPFWDSSKQRAKDPLPLHHNLFTSSSVQNLPAKQEMQVWSLGWEDFPGEENGNSL